MCGIAGLWTPDSSPREATVESMTDCLVHRGPDAAGTYVDGPAGLGNRRLAIIDPEGGDQPVCNEDGDVAVVFNGEVYNHRELRADLEAAGHEFTTDADTEVLVHAYEERGPGFVTALDGMFAVALYDATAGRLVLARDGYGIKPLVVAEDGDSLAFASELPALFEAPVDLGALDERAIARYFGLGYLPAPSTPFENVRKLHPGERVVVDADGVQRDCFHEPSVTPRDPGIDAAADELRSLVATAVERRLMADVPLGAFLSGGIDSSAVVASMAAQLDEPVRTFTVGFQEDRFDESWAGRQVAEHVGADHTEFTVSPGEVRDIVGDVLGRLGEPFADPSLLPTYVVARETSRKVTVALSGDGGDELFAGYGKYRGEYLSGYYRQVPAAIRRNVVEPAVAALPASRASGLGDAARKLDRFTAGGEPDPVRRHVGWLRLADEGTLDAVEADQPPLMASEDSVRTAHEDVDGVLPGGRRGALASMQAADVRHSLPDQLLAKVDRASMYNSLEVRVPFLDGNVVRFAFSLPRKYVITPRRRKRLLKRAFADDLPKEILGRRKQGFDMPIGEWLKGPMAGEFEAALDGLESDLLDAAAVRDTYRDHCRGRGEHGKFLWAVYVFADWHRRMRERDLLA